MNMRLSWNDRFALIDHFHPSDDQICAAFNLSQIELMTARDLKAAGTFNGMSSINFSEYDGLFNSNPAKIVSSPINSIPLTGKPVAVILPPVSAVKSQTYTTHLAKPESATKRTKPLQKRGRKGSKINSALLSVPLTPVPVDDFIKQHGVSLAVLRQSKRFIEAMGPEAAQKIGKVQVRQDKNTKVLMIWREDA